MDKRLKNVNRHGFTLVELVVVVLILGIIAAIATPKMFDTATNAKTNSTRHSLMTVRDAIQLYRAQNGALPGELGTEADLKADLAVMLNGPFPQSQVGNVGSSVRVTTSGTALTATGAQSWAYDNVSGEFVNNHSTCISW
jgi:general secretion pathway protein G